MAVHRSRAASSKQLYQRLHIEGKNISLKWPIQVTTQVNKQTNPGEGGGEISIHSCYSVLLKKSSFQQQQKYEMYNHLIFSKAVLKNEDADIA